MSLMPVDVMALEVRKSEVVFTIGTPNSLSATDCTARKFCSNQHCNIQERCVSVINAY